MTTGQMIYVIYRPFALRTVLYYCNLKWGRVCKMFYSVHRENHLTREHRRHWYVLKGGKILNQGQKIVDCWAQAPGKLISLFIFYNKNRRSFQAYMRIKL